MEKFFTCTNCTKHFNITTRRPMYLYCCGETTCIECINSLAQPQEGTVKCPFDQKELVVSQITENQHFIKGLQQMSTLINITCDKHPNNQAELYCVEHKILICCKCAILDHQGHDLKDIKREDLVQICIKANRIIDKESQKRPLLHRH